jgi:hypothetical protein
MNETRYPVRIGVKAYRKEFQLEQQYANGWQSVLKRAYGTNAVCLCSGRGSKELAIKRREASDVFHLARFPGSGPEHARDCRFYSEDPSKSGRQSYTEGVITEDDAGGLRIRLARGIQERNEVQKDQAPSVSANRRTGVRKSAMSLLGLMHLLWSEAGLNVWYPAMDGKRSMSRVHHFLYLSARRIISNRVALSEVLLVAAVKDAREAQRNATIWAEAVSSKRRAVVVSPLARYDAEKHGKGLQRLPLSGPFGMPYLNIPEAVWQRVQRSFAAELSAWEQGSKIMAIAMAANAAKSATPRADVLDLALMRVSDRWIPLDSSYEGTVEALLYEQKRSFEKPMRYDAESAVFPDFVLLDTSDEVPMEIFGMATPEYLARKAEKAAYYDERYGTEGWWKWDAVDGRNSSIPPFPSAREGLLSI